MDIISTSWFSELVMEDPGFFGDCEFMGSFDEDLAAALGEGFSSPLSPDSNSPSSALIPISSSATNAAVATLCSSSYTEATQVAAAAAGVKRPNKQRKAAKSNNKPSSAVQNLANLDQTYSAPLILSFGNNYNLSENFEQVPLGALNLDDEAVSDVLMSDCSFLSLDDANKNNYPTKKPTRTRPPSQTYDHIIAERKRREQLSQQFLALSAIVPGLKKMDKTSVLGDAIKYLKELQERVKKLEEQVAKQTMESVVFVKKSQLFLDEEEGSSDENVVAGSSDEPLPEIEARVCNNYNQIFLRIHCEKHKGILVKLLSELDMIDLSVYSTSVAPFGTLALDITIVAEMEKDYSLTIKDLVNNLRLALRRVA
uniref:Transcription factor bHLH68 n=1 Tax=Nothapodytes nimmoniana TaxID=159386 RepID=A0A9E8Z1Q4_NOTNI|nr:transcription factor bHLH68 [Nothapodytes nimmoniana]